MYCFNKRGTLSHLGIQVALIEDVLTMREQWHEQGLLTHDEIRTDCLLGGAVKNVSGLFIKAVEEGYETPQNYIDSLKEIESKKRFETERKKREEKDKEKREEAEAWRRANERLNNLPEAERQELWEATRIKILSSPEYKDATPQQLKIFRVCNEQLDSFGNY